jgi:Tfp pilus assembly protein PilV
MRIFDSRRATLRCGLTLVEVVMSTLIVGVMTVAALNALGAATQSGATAGERAIAYGLADDLMAEILQSAYSDPDETPEFGPEDGEDASTRADFDDVDDFNGWNSLPPESRDGTALADRANWRRRVVVTHVVPTNPSQATSGNADQGAKRIRVIVEYKGVVIIEQYAVRTDNS